MASILDRYGIKEVADVTFYELDESGMPKAPALFLDTLKVSTIEQTAEQAEARGGKGNPPLIIWDYGKEINVTLEDALFSAKSMAIMFGNGKVKNYQTASGDVAGEGSATSNYIMKTIQAIYDGTALQKTWEGPNGGSVAMINPRYFDAEGVEFKEGSLPEGMTQGTKYFVTFDVAVSGAVIEISANSFPGTYYVVGDTYARSEASGKDEFFQFIIPKAKVTSENTITLEAEGDPSVFNMNLRVMRPADGKMMKLVKYDLLSEESEATDTLIIHHNHDLPSAAEPATEG